MDRQLSDKEKNAAKRKMMLRIGIPVAVIAVAAISVPAILQPSMDATKMTFGIVDRGDVYTSLSASGKVVPAYEEIITSPISARIMEVYRRPGDSLETGTPLLRLDLNATEVEINKQRDNRQKQILAVEQQRLSNETHLNSIEMQIKVKQMNVSRLAAEVENERRLDSIGSGTGDRVREAELAYRTGCIELEQLRKQLENESKALDANLRSLNLDLSISDKNLGEQLRTLEDARLKSPRKATLTYINTNIGQQVSEGERIATIADFSSFKIDAEIAEANVRFLSAGGKAFVKISKKIQPATILTVTPVSTQGAVKFSVVLDSASVQVLKPGMSAEVGVVKDMKSDVLRIPVCSEYTQGPGVYELYVVNGDNIEKRTIRLGEANYDYIVVESGLEEGDKIVLSSTKSYKNKKYKLKNYNN